MRTKQTKKKKKKKSRRTLNLLLPNKNHRQPSEARKSESGVLGKPTEDVSALYVLGRVLGKGQFGTTRLAEERSTGRQLACKSIAKRKLTTPEDVEDVRREVQIMHHLKGCPHVVTLHGAYEDKHNVHLVMVRKRCFSFSSRGRVSFFFFFLPASSLSQKRKKKKKKKNKEHCTGGELFDSIVDRGHYCERDAAAMTRTIVRVVAHCHSLGVVHRDLKPENFLLASKDAEEATLKATDFGLSAFYRPGQIFSDVVGSAYYVAPEVLRRSYGKEADIWSCGVVLYIMLSGVPPFWGETEQQIFDCILKGDLDLASDPWPKISESAKDCVRRMLNPDPKKRATADEVNK